MKLEIFRLVDEIEDEHKLQAFLQLLNSPAEDDWKLSNTESVELEEALEEALGQVERGEYESHASVMERMKQRFPL